MRLYALFAAALSTPVAAAQCGGWSSVGADSARVQALLAHDDGHGMALHAAGLFPNAGGTGAPEYIARFDGVIWSSLQGGVSGGSGPWIWTMKEFDDGSGTGPALFVGGTFTTAGGVAAHNVAKWDGTTWSALGNGLSGGSDVVMALEVYDDGSGPALYAAGSFASSGVVALQNIARWNGSSWTPLGAGLRSTTLAVARALEVYDDGSGPALYAGGLFDQAGAASVSNLARWEGSSWSDVGGGLSGVPLYGVSALQAHDDGSGPALVAGGAFDMAGSLRLRIVRFYGHGCRRGREAHRALLLQYARRCEPPLRIRVPVRAPSGAENRRRRHFGNARAV